MRVSFPVLVLLLSPPVLAQTDDAAHRADRLRTQQLNREAGATAARRGRAASEMDDAAYRDARARYERERAAWRRRFDACQAGDWSACG